MPVPVPQPAPVWACISVPSTKTWLLPCIRPKREKMHEIAHQIAARKKRESVRSQRIAVTNIDARGCRRPGAMLATPRIRPSERVATPTPTLKWSKYTISEMAIMMPMRSAG